MEQFNSETAEQTREKRFPFAHFLPRLRLIRAADVFSLNTVNTGKWFYFSTRTDHSQDIDVVLIYH